MEQKKKRVRPTMTQMNELKDENALLKERIVFLEERLKTLRNVISNYEAKERRGFFSRLFNL